MRALTVFRITSITVLTIFLSDLLVQSWQGLGAISVEGGALAPTTILEIKSHQETHETHPLDLESNEENYAMFKNWLENVDWSQFVDATTIFEVLRRTVVGLNHWEEEVRYQNTCTLKNLVVSGLVNRQEIEHMGIVRAASKGLGDVNINVCRASVDVLICVIDAGLVSKDEVTMDLERTRSLVSIIKRLASSQDSSYKAYMDILNNLMERDLLATRYAKKEINGSGILRTIVSDLGNPNSSSCLDSLRALDGFVRIGLVGEEDVVRVVNELDILTNLVNGLCSLGNFVSQNSARILDALMKAKLVSKDGFENRVENNVNGNILKIIVKGLNSPEFFVRQSSANILKIFLEDGFISKERVKLLVEENQAIKSVIQGLSSWDYSFDGHGVDILKILLDIGLVTQENLLKQINQDGIIEVILRGLTDKNFYAVQYVAENLSMLVSMKLVAKEEVLQKVEQSGVMQVVRNSLVHPDFYVYSTGIKILNIFVNIGLIEKEKLAQELRGSNILSTIGQNMSDLSVPACQDNAEILCFLVSAGLVAKEEVVQTLDQFQVLESIVRILKMKEKVFYYVQACGVLKTLIDAGLVSGDMIRRHNMLEPLLLYDTFSNANDCKMYLEIFLKLVDAGFIFENTSERDRLIQFILIGLSNMDPSTRQIVSRFLSLFGQAQLLLGEKVEISRKKIRDVLEAVYSRNTSLLYVVDYYQRILSVVKDDAAIAYKMAMWSEDDLLRLSSFLDNFMDDRSLLRMEEAFVKAILRSNSRPEDVLWFIGQKVLETIHKCSRECKPQDEQKSRQEDCIDEAMGYGSLQDFGGGVKFAILVHENSAVNAARGLIKALSLPDNRVEILFDIEIDRASAKKYFPNNVVREYGAYSSRSGTLLVGFRDGGSLKLISCNGAFTASLPNAPLKYNLSQSLGDDQRRQIRSDLKIGNRKVIVLGSPSDVEFKNFMGEYNAIYGKLNVLERPVVIVAFRQGEKDEEKVRLSNCLHGQSITVRIDKKKPLSSCSLENNNILILNTLGELLSMYAIADVAVVGNDRNIFEPASQGTAVMYFDGTWHNNVDVRDILEASGAAVMFSRMALENLLSNSMQREQMAKIGLETVEEYREEILRKAEWFAVQLVSGIPRFKEAYITFLEDFLEKFTQEPINVSSVISNSRMILNAA